MAMALSIASLIIATTALVMLYHMRRSLHGLFNAKDEPQRIAKRLVLHKARQVELKQQANYLENQVASLQQQAAQSLKKIGIVRFNPYRDTGGDQSFALCILDSYDNGLMVTAIHGREGTRVYAKPIIEQKSDYELSHEEKAALEQALTSS